MAFNLNNCTLGGTVKGDPAITENQSQSWAHLTLMTTFASKVGDKWEEQELEVPLITDDERHVNTIKNYVKSGKALIVDAYYRNWAVDGQQNHGFFIRKMTFASANWNDGSNPPNFQKQ